MVAHGNIVSVRVAETKENEILITNDDNDEDNEKDVNEEEPNEEDSKKTE